MTLDEKDKHKEKEGREKTEPYETPTFHSPKPNAPNETQAK